MPFISEEIAITSGKNVLYFGRNKNYWGRNAVNFGKYCLNLGKNGYKWGNKNAERFAPGLRSKCRQNRRLSCRFRRRVAQGAPRL